VSRQAGVLAAIAAAVVMLAGCGGGGGGSKVPADPVAAVQSRSTRLGDAFQNHNVDDIMKFYSVTWTNPAGATVADLRADLETNLPLIDYVDQQGTPSYLVSDDGTEVVVGGNVTMRFRVKATGEIVTLAGTAGDIWRKLGENWFLVYSEADMSIQAALRRHHLAP
jgi:hypothetical protein